MAMTGKSSLLTRHYPYACLTPTGSRRDTNSRDGQTPSVLKFCRRCPARIKEHRCWNNVEHIEQLLAEQARGVPMCNHCHNRPRVDGFKECRVCLVRGRIYNEKHAGKKLHRCARKSCLRLTQYARCRHHAAELRERKKRLAHIAAEEQQMEVVAQQMNKNTQSEA